jgi:hypothetical protein
MNIPTPATFNQLVATLQQASDGSMWLVSNTTMPAKQIIWSEEERNKIVDEFIRLYGLTADPTDSKIRSIAKTSLPAERFRKFISPQDPVKYRICQVQNREFVPPPAARKSAKRKQSKPRLSKAANNAYLKHATNNNVATLQQHHQSETNPALLRKMLGIIHVATGVAIDSLGH